MKWRAANLLFHYLTADVCQAAVLYARRAGRLAGTAAKAAVEVLLRLGRGRGTFENLLDQLDTTARAIKFVAQHLVGWAARIANTAIDAGAQNRFGFGAGAGIKEQGSENSVHR
jgi:hypothetical protein